MLSEVSLAVGLPQKTPAPLAAARSAAAAPVVASFTADARVVLAGGPPGKTRHTADFRRTQRW